MTDTSQIDVQAEHMLSVKKTGLGATPMAAIRSGQRMISPARAR